MTFRSGSHWLVALTLSCPLGCKERIERIEDKYGDQINAAAESTDVKFTMVHTRYDPERGGFVELAAPLTKRNPTVVAEVDGTLFVLGGLNERGRYVSAVERYDDATDRWERVADWPRPGIAFTFSLGHTLCASGGYDDSKGMFRRELDCYDSKLDEWFEGPDLPLAYSSSFPVAVGGRLYLAGGSDADLKPVASVWSYAPGESQWQRETDLPEPRALMGAQGIGDELYLVGGITKGKVTLFNTEPIDAELLVYDPKTKAWKYLAPPPHSRSLYGLAEVQGKLALYFGITTGPEIELYDPGTNTWMGGGGLPIHLDFGAYIGATLGGDLFTLGLVDRATASRLGASGLQWKYDSLANRWSIVARRSDEHLDAGFGVAAHSAGLHYVGAHTTVEFDSKGFWDRLGVPIGEPPPGEPDVPGVIDHAGSSDAGAIDGTGAEAGHPASVQDGGVPRSKPDDAGERVSELVDSGH